MLIDKARVECQSHRLTVEDPVTIEYITRHIAGIQQRYTQSGGVRPFGISCLIIGFDPNENKPRLYMTEPSGIYSAWKANAIGRSSKTVREFLEKHWKADMDAKDTIKTAVKSLLEVVQTGAKNIDLAIVDGFGQIRNLTLQEIEEVVKELEVEKVRRRALGTCLIYPVCLSFLNFLLFAPCTGGGSGAQAKSIGRSASHPREHVWHRWLSVRPRRRYGIMSAPHKC